MAHRAETAEADPVSHHDTTHGAASPRVHLVHRGARNRADSIHLAEDPPGLLAALSGAVEALPDATRPVTDRPVAASTRPRRPACRCADGGGRPPHESRALQCLGIHPGHTGGAWSRVLEHVRHGRGSGPDAVRGRPRAERRVSAAAGQAVPGRGGAGGRGIPGRGGGRRPRSPVPGALHDDLGRPAPPRRAAGGGAGWTRRKSTTRSGSTPMRGPWPASATSSRSTPRPFRTALRARQVPMRDQHGRDQ